MAKYAASDEGILAIKTMSAAIVSAGEKITELTSALQTVVDDGHLGAHHAEAQTVSQTDVAAEHLHGLFGGQVAGGVKTGDLPLQVF